MRAYALHCWIILCFLRLKTTENRPDFYFVCVCVCDSSSQPIYWRFLRFYFHFFHFDTFAVTEKIASCSKKKEIRCFYFPNVLIKMQWTVVILLKKSLRQMKTKQRLFLIWSFISVSLLVLLFECKAKKRTEEQF